MYNFTEIQPFDLTSNAFKLIGKDWMLIAAGDKEKSNCMTASWGGFGFLWNKPVVFIFVRPQRYTYHILEEQEYFTLNFFKETYRSILNFCGKESGEFVDKAKECHLDIASTPNNSIAYRQAHTIIECKKLYKEQFNPESFIAQSALEFYLNNDFHYMYIAEISNCFIRN
ncbi:MAG: flavin reductase [Bacteroidales bacterium]|jgi:flavin reductase (DIM6/NTAB) family NADH-FMN oxidoreductase RutF|nr:flavin reductase [Bacteroidales bacterium]